MKMSFTVQGAEKYSNPMKEALGPKLGQLFGKSTCHHLRSLKVLDAQSCLTLCEPVNCSTPGLPVHHQLPESTQNHIHRVGDAIQLSHLNTVTDDN